jgi:hypothetical protein
MKSQISQDFVKIPNRECGHARVSMSPLVLEKRKSVSWCYNFFHKTQITSKEIFTHGLSIQKIVIHSQADLCSVGPKADLDEAKSGLSILANIRY